jgi:hypothetical protein
MSFEKKSLKFEIVNSKIMMEKLERVPYFITSGEAENHENQFSESNSKVHLN